jgi:hypothetical protein
MIAAASIGLVFVTTTPAHAAIWISGDGFENNPAAVWWFENPGGGAGNFVNWTTGAHSGSWYAEIYRDTPGWNSIDRAVTLPVSLTKRCTASAYFFSSSPSGMDVINASNWTYVATGVYHRTPGAGWERFSISWTGGPANVVLRFVVASTDRYAHLDIDETSVVCYT